MIKTYTLKDKIHKVISAKKGSMHYVLVDSQGEERTVKAIAKLGMTKKIKSVQAIYHRETPLVTALSNASLNDVIRVDFSEFNKYNPRDFHALSKAQATKRLRKINVPQYSSNWSYFSVDPIRVFQLFLMVSLGIAAYVSI